MIAYLKGLLKKKAPGSTVVLTGGVGYEVLIPLSTYYDLPDEGEDVSLFIKTVVRDDAIELFGFFSQAEKEAFILLNSVSKIGPRLALSILSGIGPAALVEAVGSKNLARLSSIPGVGVKTAERLVLELKDKVAQLAVYAPTVRVQPQSEALDEMGQDAVSALLNLGYSRTEAARAVTSVLDEAGDADYDLSGLLRQGLKRLRKA